jgi:epoxyqueuosine reductase QueG
MGYRALPVPASQMMDWDRLLGHLSHRELGALAGIGWRGRNNLLVHPEFGSRVRYTSILTDAPLPDRGIDLDAAAGCGDCRACVGACPAGAIKMDPLAFDLDRCAAQVRRFSKSEKLNALICGICVKACGGASAPGAEARAARAGGQA